MNSINGIGISQPSSGVHERLVPTNATNIVRANAESTLGVSQTSNGSETTSLSAAAGMLTSALAGSDVRMDRVAQLQQSIGAGTYNVPASDVAGKMLSALIN